MSSPSTFSGVQQRPEIESRRLHSQTPAFWQYKCGILAKGGKIVSVAAGCDPSGLIANMISEKAAGLVESESVDVKKKSQEKKSEDKKAEEKKTPAKE